MNIESIVREQPEISRFSVHRSAMTSQSIFALHLSLLGAFVSSQTGTFDGGLGFSLSLVDDHIFLTGGVVYNGRQLVTPGTGLLPPNTQVPTTPAYNWPLVFGATFRL